jgi:hypothetical protein
MTMFEIVHTEGACMTLLVMPCHPPNAWFPTPGTRFGYTSTLRVDTSFLLKQPSLDNLPAVVVMTSVTQVQGARKKAV